MALLTAHCADDLSGAASEVVLAPMDTYTDRECALAAYTAEVGKWREAVQSRKTAQAQGGVQQATGSPTREGQLIHHVSAREEILPSSGSGLI